MVPVVVPAVIVRSALGASTDTVNCVLARLDTPHTDGSIGWAIVPDASVTVKPDVLTLAPPYIVPQSWTSPIEA